MHREVYVYHCENDMRQQAPNSPMVVHESPSAMTLFQRTGILCHKSLRTPMKQESCHCVTAEPFDVSILASIQKCLQAVM